MVPSKNGTGSFQPTAAGSPTRGSGLSRPFLYAATTNEDRFLALVGTTGAISPVTIWMNWMAGIGK